MPLDQPGIAAAIRIYHVTKPANLVTVLWIILLYIFGNLVIVLRRSTQIFNCCYFHIFNFRTWSFGSSSFLNFTRILNKIAFSNRPLTL